jgi:hypothetical protein
MYCKKWLSAASTGGTKHLQNHLKSCPAKCAPGGLKQQKLRLSENADGVSIWITVEFLTKNLLGKILQIGKWKKSEL